MREKKVLLILPYEVSDIAINNIKDAYNVKNVGELSSKGRTLWNEIPNACSYSKVAILLQPIVAIISTLKKGDIVILGGNSPVATLNVNNLCSRNGVKVFTTTEHDRNERLSLTAKLNAVHKYVQIAKASINKYRVGDTIALHNIYKEVEQMQNETEDILIALAKLKKVCIIDLAQGKKND